MSNRDGGAAFPQAYAKFSGNDHGMTLRDYFAAQALAGMGTWSPGASHMLNSEEGQKNRASWAYAQADAMLEARKR